MRRLFTAWGVDYDQWRALTIAGLRIDFRTVSIGGNRTPHKLRGIAFIALQLLVYSIVGSILALGVRLIPDPFLAAVILLTLVMFMVGTTILVEHNSIVTSPDDHAILGFQPITSRTWFAARLANVLVYTLGLATAVGYLPVILFFVRHGAGMGLAAIPALYGSAIAVTLTVILVYGWLLRVAGPGRLRRALSWIQLTVSMLIYGSYILVSRGVSRSALQTFSLPKTGWVLLYPATWFASWIELARGLAGLDVVVPAAAALALLAVLARSARGKLSLEYSERLGALVTDTAGSKRGSGTVRPGRWFRRGEARAVAILVRAQFRSDTRFRMGVLSILPLTLIYLYLGLNPRGASGTSVVTSGANYSFLTLAVMLFPATLKLHLGRSDAFRAAWIFFASPSDRTRLVRSAKNVLVAYFLVPYLGLVGVLLVAFRQDPLYAAVYVFVAGLASHLVLLLVTLFDPQLPFARPMLKGRGSAVMIVALGAIAVFGALLPLLLRWVYGRAGGMLLLVAAIVGLSLLVDRLTRARVERRAGRMEFEG